MVTPPAAPGQAALALLTRALRRLSVAFLFGFADLADPLTSSVLQWLRTELD